jgi:5-methylcytosine-specific restriction endonuclease McrA
MSDISPSMRAAVVHRASDRCEYCRLSQIGQEAAFHIDHVVPRDAGGATALDNLALACVSCSLRKWAKQTATDPVSREELPLFNPRLHVWAQHFRWEDERLVALTPTARATIAALSMNRTDSRHPTRGNTPRTPPTHLTQL